MSKQESIFLKSVAILLMFMHHFFSSTFMSYEKITPPIWDFLAEYSKITVAMFAMLSGYAISILNEKYTKATYVLEKSIKFLKSYWVYVFLFLIIGILSSDKLPDQFTFVSNLFGFNVGMKEVLGYEYINVTFAWYVRFYLCVLITVPFFIKAAKKYGSAIVTTLAIILFTAVNLYFVNDDSYFIRKVLLVYTQWMPCVLVGYILGEYSVLQKADKIPLYVLLLAVPVSMITRKFIGADICGISIDFIYAGIVILSCLSLYRNSKFLQTNKVLLWLGVHSTSLWFMQSIFFIPSHQWNFLITWSNIPPVGFITGVILTSLIVYCIAPLIKFINNIKFTR